VLITAVHLACYCSKQAAVYAVRVVKAAADDCCWREHLITWAVCFCFLLPLWPIPPQPASLGHCVLHSKRGFACPRELLPHCCTLRPLRPLRSTLHN